MKKMLYKLIIALLVIAMVLPGGGFTAAPAGVATPEQAAADTPAIEWADVTPDDWFYHYVTWSVAHEIIRGPSEENPYFNPYEYITRGEFIIMLGLLTATEGRRATVSRIEVSDREIFAWAVYYHLIIGDGYGNLMLDEVLTREQLMVIVDRFLRHIYWITFPRPPDIFQRYQDVQLQDFESLSPWAKDAYVEYKIVTNLLDYPFICGQFIRPQGGTTRSNALLVAYRLDPILPRSGPNIPSQ